MLYKNSQYRQLNQQLRGGEQNFCTILESQYKELILRNVLLLLLKFDFSNGHTLELQYSLKLYPYIKVVQCNRSPSLRILKESSCFISPYYTAQKIKFSIKDFFNFFKSLMENFIFCAVLSVKQGTTILEHYYQEFMVAFEKIA